MNDVNDLDRRMAQGSVDRPAFAVPATEENLLLRLAVERFLFEEAALLDDWRLDEWLALFTEDARYVVPATDMPHGDPRSDMMMIDDDHVRLVGRVNRLKSRHAHREFPYSRTRRLVTNVRLTAVTDGAVHAEAAFIVYRMRMDTVAPYVGLYRYVLVRAEDGGFLIRYRRAELDLERLSDHATVSIIL